MKQFKTYKFRMYPTAIQIKILEHTLNTCRFLYNDCLADRKNAYERTGETVNCYDQQYELKNRKGINVHSQVAQDVLKRLQKSFDNFFRRVKNREVPGYPRFQGCDRYNSFTYPQSGFKILDDGKLQLSKIGDLKLIQHREINGKIKTCTIKRKGIQWYASFVTEIDVNVELIKIQTAVGIDLGIKTLAVLSTGENIPNIKTTNKYEKKLAKAQRKLSKKKKGSNNRKKQKIKVQTVHRKIKNTRKDYLHKQSTILVNTWDLIVLEDLQVKDMVKNHRLSKSIVDVAWNTFTSMIKYKAEYAGKNVIFVNPKNTSKICSACGYIQDISLSERIYDCLECNLVLDRDHNAAINILNRVGTTRMSTPVKMFIKTLMKQESSFAV